MLQPDKKKQLDKNIRMMLENGATQDDIIAYSNEFKDKYVKKKSSDGIGQNQNVVSEAKNTDGSSASQGNKLDAKGWSYGDRIEELKSAPVENKPTQTPKPKTAEEKKSFLSNLGTNLKAGFNDFNKIVSSIPESVYDIFAMPQNAVAYMTGANIETSSKKFKDTYKIKNPLLDAYTKEGEKINVEIEKFNAENYQSSSIYENVKKGKYQDAFELIASGVVRSAPVSVSMMVGGGTMKTGELATLGTVAFTNQNKEELDAEHPEMSEIEKTIKAVGLSGAEMVFSAIGEGTIGSVYKDIVKKEGKEVGAEIFKKGLIESYKKALEKHGVVAGALGEMLEEGATQITQNMINNKPYMEGVFDAMAIGGASGTVMTSPITINNAKNKIANIIKSKQASKVMSNDTKAKIDNIDNAIEKIDKDLKKDVPESIKENLQAVKTKLEAEKESAIESDYEKFKNLPQEQKDKLNGLEEKLDLLKSEYDEIENNPNLSRESKDILKKEKSDEAEKLLNSKKEIIDAKSEKTATKTKESTVETATPETEAKSKGKTIKVYHGTPKQFDSFDFTDKNSESPLFGVGLYTTTLKDLATFYSKKGNSNDGKVIEMEISVNNPISSKSQEYIELENKYTNKKELSDELKNRGYDAIEVDLGEFKNYVIFDQSQILKDNLNNNETTPPNNTTTDADLRPNIEPSEQQGKDNNVQETVEPATSEAEAKVEDQINHAVKEVEKGVLGWGGNPFSPRIDLGISRADVRKGESDIKKGNYSTVPAKRVIEALAKAKEQGYYDYMQGSGGKIEKLQVPLTEQLDADTELSVQELDEINKNQEQLSKDYDVWFNSLDESTQNEILDDYEQTNDTRTVGEDVKRGKGKENVSDKQEPKPSPKTKEKRVAKDTKTLYEAHRDLFGTDKSKSFASAVVVDNIIGAMAKRRGISKEEMYGKIEFRKGNESTVNNLSKNNKPLFQIVGKKANLSNTIKDNLIVARDLEKQGKDTETIYLSTGWTKGVDGKWKYDLHEGDVSIKEGMGNIADFVKYDEFFKAYPDAKKIKVRIRNNENSNLLGSFNDDTNTLFINTKNGLDDARLTLLHELQHWVQNKEGFAKGGNEKIARETLDKNIKLAKSTGLKRALLNFKQALSGKKANSESLSQNLDKLKTLTEKDDFTLYESLAGEVEARNVENRYGMDEAMRRNTTLDVTEDVANDEKIVLFQNAQGAMLAEDGKFIVYALTDPNVSTPLHEMAHVYEHYLDEQERKDILDWAKHTEWTRETSEMFARGFEKYLADGKAPNAQLQKIFDKFKEWLTDIYNGLKGSEIDIELSSKVEDIFAKMLGAENGNTPPPNAPKKQKSNSESGNKKSLLNRLIDGGNDKEITEVLEELGKNYDVRNQEHVRKLALKFIEKVGIAEALLSAKNKTIVNTDTRFVVYAEALEQLKTEIDNTTDINEKNSLFDKFQELSDDFDKQARDAGQGIAILNYIYQNSQNLKYSLQKQVRDYKMRDPNGEIPHDVLDKFKELDTKLKDVENQLKEAEKRAKEAEEQLELKNTIDDIVKPNKSKQRQAKELANKIRSLKIHRPNTLSAASPATIAWDGAIELVAKTIEKGGTIVEAIEKGLNHIRKTKWYQNLSNSDKAKEEKAFSESLENATNELTEEQKIERAEKLLERSIKKIKKEIETNDIEFKKKPTPAQSDRLTQLRKEYQDLFDTKQEMRELAGLIEQRKLAISKKRVEKQIEDYKRRIREKDFVKKEVNRVKEDEELINLKGEREAVFEEYEKERHRQELANRTAKQKWIDAILEFFAIGRAIKASLDLGLIGIQLRHFTYRELFNNPVGLGKKLIKMFGAIGSQSKTDKARKQLIAHPLYSLANKLDIGLTNPDLRDEVREEASAGSMLSYAWNLPMMVFNELGGEKYTSKEYKSIGDALIDGFKEKSNEVLGTNYEISEKKKYSIKDQWKNINLFRDVERGLSTYGNQVRFEEFVRGVERLRAQGKDDINHKEDYEALASYVRTFSGRAKPAGLEMNQKALNVFFFSFRNAASIFQQLNPLYYKYLQTHTVDGLKFKPTVANRMAMTSMLRTATANMMSMAFIMAGYAALKDDDDEEMTLETDPRSSDFGKLKVGNFRYDTWGGYAPLVVLYARLLTEEVKRTTDGKVYSMGENYGGIGSRGEAIGNFAKNKFSPLFSAIYKYGTSKKVTDKETGESKRVTDYGKDLLEDDAYSVVPIFIGSVKDAVKHDYDGVKAFLTAYSVLGLGNTQDYGKTLEEQKADMQEKMDKRKARPKRKTLEERKAERNKKQENEAELRNEAKKLGVKYVPPKR